MTPIPFFKLTNWVRVALADMPLRAILQLLSVSRTIFTEDPGLRGFSVLMNKPLFEISEDLPLYVCVPLSPHYLNHH
ncbi:MAG: hypothetical protein L0922_05760, partial [Candidatus Mariimomonas ferrooxydans]